MIKAHFSGRMVSSGISNVAIASVHSEKTSMKKLIIIIIIMKKLQETTAFSGHQKLPSWNRGQKSDSRLQIWCSILVSLHREPPEFELVEKLSGHFIGGWSCVCHPYIESATALSDKKQELPFQHSKQSVPYADIVYHCQIPQGFRFEQSISCRSLFFYILSVWQS